MDFLAEQLLQFTYTPWVFLLLFVHSCLESFLLPGAHDFLLVAVDVARPSMCFVFASMSALGSACGGILGYSLGRFGGRPVLSRFVSHSIIDKIEVYFQKYGIWAVAVAGFTPLPYKFFAIAAGMFEVNFIAFVCVSLVTRAMRFFLVSGVLYIVGPRIKDYIVSYFNIFSIVCFVCIIVFYVLVTLHKRKKRAHE